MDVESGEFMEKAELAYVGMLWLWRYRQVGLQQRSRLLTVVWLVSQYRACQVASPTWTDRQTVNPAVWPSTSAAGAGPRHCVPT